MKPNLTRQFVQLLISYGAIISTLFGPYYYHALHWAISTSNIYVVVSIGDFRQKRKSCTHVCVDSKAQEIGRHFAQNVKIPLKHSCLKTRVIMSLTIPSVYLSVLRGSGAPKNLLFLRMKCADARCAGPDGQSALYMAASDGKLCWC